MRAVPQEQRTAEPGAGLSRSGSSATLAVTGNRARVGLALLLLVSFWAPLRHAHSQATRGRTRSPHGPLTIACENCHTSTSWKPIRPAPDFNHTETRFPLRGLHVAADCRRCHVKLVFSDVGKDCAGCHADLHRGQFGGKCDTCHTVRGWRVSLQAVKRHENRFPLMGAHAAVECDSCHKGAATGVFVGLSTDCVACHLTDYQSASAPDHQAGKLPLKCDECHNFDTWLDARFDHARFTGFQLAGAHARLECINCHTAGFSGTPANCFSCHAKDFAGATDPNHAKAGFPHDCSQCHNSLSWTGASFDHATRTRFTLAGAHASARCDQCHVSGRYAGTPQDCAGCHARDYDATKNPNHKAAGLPTGCASCHSTENWQGAKFDHNLVRFPLTGTHGTLACTACHGGGTFAGASSACASCHLSAFNSARNPNHADAGFPQDCTLCHTTAQWKGAKFDHTAATRFPLTGSHVSVSCTGCHKNSVYKGTSNACVSCHLTVFNKTVNPNHAAAGFPQDCALCHTTAQWKGATFDHSQTKLPLTGAHAAVDCQRCHAAGQFSGLNTACASCHLTDFNKTTNPNHTAAGFPQDCALCHTTTQWKGAKFDHSRTKFPLAGAHAALDCQRCHAAGRFAGLNAACASCHLTDFNNTRNPNHAAAGFPQDCSVCHTTSQWKGAKFDHSAATKFPLTGAHVTAACSDCHRNGVFAGLPVSCVSCHLTNYNSTTNPNHVAAGFPQDCSICHTTVQWKGAVFDHSRTGFILTGAHLQAACIQCHADNRYAGTPRQCSACHLTNYTSTTNPNHAAAGFPQDCSLCHTTTSWAGATFNHSTATSFPLTGAHTSVQCSVCHRNNVFAGLSTACVSCHLANYSNTTNPNHVAAGFPQDCSICHTTTTWAGASFNHSQTPFPLSGAHLKVQCANCHIGGKYAGTPTDCYSCHQKVYTSTTNPNHVAAGFPHDCSLCHSTTTWTGAIFNHTGFPIYSGSHQGRWTTCGDCHTNSSNYSVFSCLTCHAHEKTQMDQKHAGIRDYVYNSANCYACHPTGRGG